MAVLNFTNGCMPADIYGMLYQVEELDVVVAIVKNIYAKKPEHRAAMGTTPFPCITL